MTSARNANNGRIGPKLPDDVLDMLVELLQLRAAKFRIRLVTARTAAAYMTDNRELTKSRSAPKSLPKPHIVKPKDKD